MLPLFIAGGGYTYSDFYQHLLEVESATGRIEEEQKEHPAFFNGEDDDANNGDGNDGSYSYGGDHATTVDDLEYKSHVHAYYFPVLTPSTATSDEYTSDDYPGGETDEGELTVSDDNSTENDTDTGDYSDDDYYVAYDGVQIPDDVRPQIVRDWEGMHGWHNTEHDGTQWRAYFRSQLRPYGIDYRRVTAQNPATESGRWYGESHRGQTVTVGGRDFNLQQVGTVAGSSGSTTNQADIPQYVLADPELWNLTGPTQTGNTITTHSPTYFPGATRISLVSPDYGVIVALEGSNYEALYASNGTLARYGFNWSLIDAGGRDLKDYGLSGEVWSLVTSTAGGMGNATPLFWFDSHGWTLLNGTRITRANLNTHLPQGATITMRTTIEMYNETSNSNVSAEHTNGFIYMTVERGPIAGVGANQVRTTKYTNRDIPLFNAVRYELSAPEVQWSWSSIVPVFEAYAFDWTLTEAEPEFPDFEPELDWPVFDEVEDLDVEGMTPEITPPGDYEDSEPDVDGMMPILPPYFPVYGPEELPPGFDQGEDDPAGDYDYDDIDVDGLSPELPYVPYVPQGMTPTLPPTGVTPPPAAPSTPPPAGGGYHAGGGRTPGAGVTVVPNLPETLTQTGAASLALGLVGAALAAGGATLALKGKKANQSETSAADSTTE